MLRGREPNVHEIPTTKKGRDQHLKMVSDDMLIALRVGEDTGSPCNETCPGQQLVRHLHAGLLIGSGGVESSIHNTIGDGRTFSCAIIGSQN